MDKTIEDVKVFNRCIGGASTLRPMEDTERQLMDFIGRYLAALAFDIKTITEGKPFDHVLRMRLIVEEAGEVANAMANEDRAQQLKEFVDLRYVADGFTELAGFDGAFSEAFRRVHKSNLSKLGPDGQPVRDATGKVMKGPNYQPPELADLVAPV